MLRYEIRAAAREDEGHLLTLAGFLDTVNLPHDHAHVRRLLDESERSFASEIVDIRHRKYVFVLWDLEEDRAVGTSMILAQLGRRDAPYIYFDVLTDEKYHAELDKHFEHTVLRLGFSYDGPTEIGGLVMHPDYRRAPEKLGLFISYVRFLYIAANQALFQDEVLAELLPPLEDDGTSLLWEALGRHFTGMSYAEADLLSSEDKTFVRDLFPSGAIYASLLSDQAQRVIGEVGAQTKGVEKMLRRIGFRYAERIDPFDGGPHFLAEVNDISLIQDTRRCQLGGTLRPSREVRQGLVAREYHGPPYLRAVLSPLAFDENGHAHISDAAGEHLELTRGDPLLCLPLSGRRND